MFKVFKSTGIEGSYSISSNPTFVNNNCWSVYSAKHRTTKKQCSVWEFDKRECENRLLDSGVVNKKNKKMILDDVYERLKTFVSNQSKLKHPNFLTVIEPFEDHKSRILFVTEYVKGDLNSMDKTDLDEITITKGILQVSQGLKFLHDQLKTVHSNICPSAIVITDSFDWKITGLSFMEALPNGGSEEKFVDPVDQRLPNFLSIDFRYTSPNLLTKHRMDYVNDIFSVCLVIYYLFQYEPLLKCSHSSSISDFERQVSKLNNILRDSKHASFNNVPDYYYPVLTDLLRRTQESNTDVIQLDDSVLTIDTLIQSNIFNNPLIQMLTKVDNFDSIPVEDRVQLLEELKQFVGKFPKTLIFNKIIPMLTGVVDLNVFKKGKQLQDEDQQLLVKSTENLILVSKGLSQLTFFEQVFPFIQRVMQEHFFEGYQIVLINNLPNLQSFMKASRESSFTESFAKFLVDLFQKSCSGDSVILQELLLTNIGIFLDFEPYNVITNVIFPSVMTIYSTTTSLKVKNLSIHAFIVMASGMGEKNIDDALVIEKLLPLLQGTSQSNYSNAKFLMNMLKLYECISAKFSSGMSKSIQINKESVSMMDVQMTVMFDIWKLTKFAKFDTDLKEFFGVLESIEGSLKKELKNNTVADKRTTEDVSKMSRGASPVIKTTPSMPMKTNTYTTTTTPMTPMSSAKPMGMTSNIPVMQPKNSLKPIASTAPLQAATRPTPITLGQNKPAGPPKIDWSKSSTLSTPKGSTQFAVMTAKPRNASPAPVTPSVDEGEEWDTFKSAGEDKWASLI